MPKPVKGRLPTGNVSTKNLISNKLFLRKQLNGCLYSHATIDVFENPDVPEIFRVLPTHHDVGNIAHASAGR